MPLLATADIECELNITLTGPYGPETVNHLIASVISWAETRIGHKLGRGMVIDSFDGGDALYLLSNPIHPELTSRDACVRHVAECLPPEQEQLVSVCTLPQSIAQGSKRPSSTPSPRSGYSAS
jgi:hypothetical protein